MTNNRLTYISRTLRKTGVAPLISVSSFLILEQVKILNVGYLKNSLEGFIKGIYFCSLFETVSPYLKSFEIINTQNSEVQRSIVSIAVNEINVAYKLVNCAFSNDSCDYPDKAMSFSRPIIKNLFGASCKLVMGFGYNEMLLCNIYAEVLGELHDSYLGNFLNKTQKQIPDVNDGHNILKGMYKTINPCLDKLLETTVAPMPINYYLGSVFRSSMFKVSESLRVHNNISLEIEPSNADLFDNTSLVLLGSIMTEEFYNASTFA